MSKIIDKNMDLPWIESIDQIIQMKFIWNHFLQKIYTIIETKAIQI